MVIIGVDPHGRTHTASALEPGTHRVVATVQIDAMPAGYRQLVPPRGPVRRSAVSGGECPRARRTTHLLRQLHALGYQVQLTDTAA